jgi:hypothetical protein
LHIPYTLTTGTAMPSIMEGDQPMTRKLKNTKLDFNVVHDMAISFASARMNDYKYPDDIDRDELREFRYSNFLTDYAFVISQYQKAIECTPSDSSVPDGNALNISITLFDSILKLSSNSD